MIITTAYVTAVLVALAPMLIFSSSFAAHAQPQQPPQSEACPEGFELNNRGYCQTEPLPDRCPESTEPIRFPIVEFEGICYAIHFDPAQRECPPNSWPSKQDPEICEFRVDEEGNPTPAGELIETVPLPEDPICIQSAPEQGIEEQYYDIDDDACVVVDDELAKVPGGCPEGTREDASGNCVVRPGRGNR